MPRAKARIAHRPPSPPRWRGADSLGLVYQFNERCLRVLSETAATSNARDQPAIWRHRELCRNSMPLLLGA
jgi:hypothetical protein